MPFIGLTATAALIVAALTLGHTPASAECVGVSGTDACLVGTWRQTGGGAEAWMQRNLPPGVPVPQIETQGDETMSLGPDGSFSTGPRQGTAKVEFGQMQVESDITGSAKGRWSAANGKLNLCPAAADTGGEVRIIGPGGQQFAMPVSPESEEPVSLDYVCAGNTLETSLAFPEMDDPLTTQYTRAP
jgi:hypothetical protein